MLEERGKGWYFTISRKDFNVWKCNVNSYVVQMPSHILYDKKKFITFVRAEMISEARVLRQRQQRHQFEDAVYLSCSYLSNFMKCSKATAWRYRKKAVEAKHIFLLHKGKPYKPVILATGCAKMRESFYDSVMEIKEPWKRLRYRIRRRFNIKQKKWVFDLLYFPTAEVETTLKFRRIRPKYDKDELTKIRWVQSYKKRLS